MMNEEYNEEEFAFPFDAQAAATSARVPRAGIVVPLRRKGGAGGGFPFFFGSECFCFGCWLPSTSGGGAQSSEDPSSFLTGCFFRSLLREANAVGGSSSIPESSVAIA